MDNGQDSAERFGYMKRVLIITGNFVLVFAAVTCVMGALISAFSFTVDTRALVWCWLIAAFVLSALTTIWRGKALLILIIPALALLYWKMSDIVFGAKWVISYITGEFNVWIDIPVLFPDARPGVSAQTYFFAAAGACLAFPLTFSICLRRSAVLTIVFTVPLAFLTFVLTTYPPNLWFILGLLAVVLTLIISGALHPYDFAKMGTAVFPALLLTAILMTAAYLLTMTDNDRRGDLIGFIDDRIRLIGVQAGFTRASFGAGWPELNSDVWRFDTDYVRVSRAGPRTITDRSMLEVTASQAGTYYLRGYSLQQFDGRAWHTNPDTQRTDEENYISQMTADIALQYYIYNLNSGSYAGESGIKSMTIIKTGDRSDLAYLPYYSRSSALLISFSGGFPNLQSNLTSLSQRDSYTVDFIHIDGSLPVLIAEHTPDSAGAYGTYMYDQYQRQLSSRIYRTYTRIEDSTSEALRQIALDAGIDPDADRAAISDAVAAYVSSVARYNLSPIPIPLDEDFALYFLQKTRQGYCIHFATAAALMLRSLDIPARFASGFVVTVPPGKAGESIVVTDRYAHAWVEVFYDDIGWVPLEVTPSSPGSGIPARNPFISAGDYSLLDDYYDDYYDDDYYPDSQTGQSSGSSASPSASPSAPAASQGQDQPNASGISMILWAVTSCVAACILILVFRRIITHRRREKRFTQENANEAVIILWRYILRLKRRIPPPAEIEDLALKARFSQHRISEDERAAVLDYAMKQRDEAYEIRRLPGRLWLKYVRLC